MPITASLAPSGDRIVLDSEFQHKDRIKNILGAKHDPKTDKWTTPLTWSACTGLLNDFGAEFLASKDINDWGYAELEARVGPSLALRAKLDLDSMEPGVHRSTKMCETALELGAETGLYPYQMAGAAWAAIVGQGMLLDEQGTGKTAQTIAALRIKQRHGEPVFPVLVTAPSSVKRVWEREFARWYPGLTVINVKGSAVQRRKQLATPAHVYIVSYNNMPKHSKLAPSPGAPAMKRCGDCGGYDPTIDESKCQAHSRELNAIEFRTVICDEAHRIINPKVAWTRAIWSVSDLANNRYALTGTPVQENIADFWGLLRFVQPREFPAKTKFLDRFAIMGYSPWGSPEIQGLNPLRERELEQITHPYWRRMLKKVAVPFLPPVVTERRTVEMTGAQAKAYRDFKKSMVAELEGSVRPLVATIPLTKASRLMQLASSYAEVLDPTIDETDPEAEEPAAPVRLSMPSNKITAFLEDLDNGDFSQDDAGTIVFAQSTQLLEMLSAELTRKGVDHGKVTGGQSEDARNDAVDAFQAGKFKFILVSITAGGAGLTLTAANKMVYLQRSWSSTAMTQSFARADRIGSEIHDSIRIIHYMSEDTVEDHQLEWLLEKNYASEAILKDNRALLTWIQEADAKIKAAA